MTERDRARRAVVNLVDELDAHMVNDVIEGFASGLTRLYQNHRERLATYADAVAMERCEKDEAAVAWSLALEELTRASTMLDQAYQKERIATT